MDSWRNLLPEFLEHFLNKLSKKSEDILKKKLELEKILLQFSKKNRGVLESSIDFFLQESLEKFLLLQLEAFMQELRDESLMIIFETFIVK